MLTSSRPIHRSRSRWQPLCRGPSRRARWVSSSISKFPLGGCRHTDRGFAPSPKCRRVADSKSAQSLGCEALRFPSALPRRSGLPPGLTIGLLLGEELLYEIGDYRGAPGVLVHEIGGQLQPAAAGDAVE